MNELTAEGSGNFKVTSRWMAAAGGTGPRAIACAGNAGLALASSTVSPEGTSA